MNKCVLVKDILPLYIDDVLASESRVFVEKHLKGCPNCQSELAKLSMPVSEKQEHAASTLKKIRKKNRRKTILISVCSIVLCAVLLVAAQFAYMGIRDHQLTRSFKEYVLSDFAFQNEIYGDSMYVHNPSVFIEQIRTDEVFEYVLDSEYDGLQKRVFFPRIDSVRYNEPFAGSTTVSVSIHKNGLYQGVVKERTRNKHYEAFFAYCENNSLFGDIELSRFLIEYPLVKLTKNSEYSELEIAYAVQQMRPFTTNGMFGWGKTIEGDYLQRQYFPLKGWVNGYALFTSWLVSEDGEREDFDRGELSAGMKRWGSWYINLQMGDHVCEINIVTTDMAESNFVSKERVWSFLGGFRWTIGNEF